MKTTEQVPNPTGKGGFGDHPENRNPGGWKKDESITYQYNKLLRMTPEEIAMFIPETVAQEIALERIKAARKASGLPETKEITDRTEGKAPQFIGLGDEDDYAKIALVRFMGEDDEPADSTS